MPPRKETRISAYGLLLQADKILLCRLAGRSFGNEGKWTLPGGGLEFAETPEAAMVREVREETGLDVQPTSIAGIDTLLVELPELHHHGIRIIYHTSTPVGTLRFERHGTTDRCEWFTPQQALALPLVSLAQTGLALAFPETAPADTGTVSVLSS
ncbi:MAG: NUDIX domain-containing protein [Thiolinea sp.]